MSRADIPSPGGLLRLEKGRLKDATMMMARAFRDDPIVAWAFTKKGGEDPRMPNFYEMPLRLGIRSGLAFTTSPRLEGAAVWARQERGYRMSWWDVLFSGAFMAAMRMGAEPGRRMQSIFNMMGERHNRYMPGPHWYLMLLGVDPEHQGRGYAAWLLRGMYERIDAESLPAYLETETEKNAAMYEHMGFKTVEEVVPPGTNVRMWLMLREGRG